MQNCLTPCYATRQHGKQSPTGVLSSCTVPLFFSLTIFSLNAIFQHWFNQLLIISTFCNKVMSQNFHTVRFICHSFYNILGCQAPDRVFFFFFLISIHWSSPFVMGFDKCIKSCIYHSSTTKISSITSQILPGVLSSSAILSSKTGKHSAVFHFLVLPLQNVR